MTQMEISTLILVFDCIGIVAFTLMGYILASKMQFDLLGIIFIAFSTAFAGGVFRDIIVDRVPFIFEHTYPLSIALLTIFISYLSKLHYSQKVSENKLFLVSDSIGMNTFAITGSLIAVEHNFNLGGIVFLALMTAIGGSIVRDIIMNKTPYFLKNEFYGTIAIMDGVLIWLFDKLNLIANITIIFILLFGVLLRLMAIKYHWKLPSIKYSVKS